MNFPDEPIFRILHWLIDTPTLGGAVVFGISGLVAIGTISTIIWIVSGAQADEPDSYLYPTTALLGHDNHSE